jgi:hypothetical protein
MTTADQVRNAFPALRAFVFGEEITEDISRVTINLSDDRAPSTCEIVLANKFDRYITTERDIHALYDDVDVSTLQLPDVLSILVDAIQVQEMGDVPNRFSAERGTTSVQTNELETFNEVAEKHAGHIDRLVRERLQRTIQDGVKSRVLNAKISERVQIAQPDLTVTTTEGAKGARSSAALTGDALRYPLQQGDCIFHSNDPLRIFLRDPFNPNVWFHLFTGFVSDWSDNVDADNQKIVTLRGEDVLRSFRYARVTTNPGVFDDDAVKEIEDLTVLTSFKAGFAGLTLVDMLYTIIWGPTLANTNTLILENQTTEDGQSVLVPIRRVSVNGSLTSKVPREGVGAFDPVNSVVAIFGPEASDGVVDKTATPAKEVKITSLGAYQGFIDHQVRETDLESMQDSRSTVDFKSQLPVDPATGRISANNIITAIGKNPHHFPVDGGRLIMLVPGSLGVETNRKIITEELINSIATRTTFRSRLDMIYDALREIEFSFYATPKGDLAVEMPLYDFEPDDFGEDAIVSGGSDQAATNELNKLREASGLPPITKTGESFGPFAPHYRVPKRDTIQFTRAFSDEKVRTQFRTTPHITSGTIFQGTHETVGLPPQVGTLRSLIPQFGVRIEQRPVTSFISTPEGATVYGYIKLNQLNADSRSAQVDVVPRMRPQPNRPMLFSERNYIATLRSRSLTLDWNNDFTMDVGVNYIRGWDGSVRDGDPSKLIYRPIGGTASRPMNYKVLFGLEDTSESVKSGPQASIQDKGTTGQGVV